MKYLAVIFDYANSLAYQRREAYHLVVPDEMRTFVRHLYERGYRLGIISNSHRYGDRLWLCQRLQDNEILAYFHGVLSSGAEMHEKPDPEFFWQMQQFMNIRPEKILMVGDSQRCDIDGARAIRMGTLLCNIDETGPQRLIQNIRSELDDPHWDHRIHPNILQKGSGAGENQYNVLVRDLSHPVNVGDHIIWREWEMRVTAVSAQLTREQILNPRNRDTVTITMEEVR